MGELVKDLAMECVRISQNVKLDFTNVKLDFTNVKQAFTYM